MTTPENIVKPTFYGNTISDYGIEQGFVDYRTLAKCFNLVLCNEIINKINDFERVNENEESEEYEVFQWYIIDQWGAELLGQWLPNEIVYYSEDLDLHIWGVCHYGTAWSGVLTDIAIIYNEHGGFDFQNSRIKGY